MTEIPHFGFILAAYVIAAVAILGMIGAVLIDYRSLSRQLEALESRREGQA